MSYRWIAGEEVTASKLNRSNSSLDNATVTYNSNGNIATVYDADSAITYTFTYDAEYKLLQIYDGLFTWTIAYGSDGNPTSITRT